MRLILPGYEISASGLKPDQEIYNMLRDLGYRYSLNKQHLATIGVPHTWPYALAALDWLREEAELNELSEKADDGDDPNFSLYADDEDGRRALYRQNEARLYARYLSGEDDPDFSDFVTKLDEMMMNGSAADEKSLEVLRAECERLEEEVAERTQGGREGPLQEARKSLEAATKQEASRQEELNAMTTKIAETRDEIAAIRLLREAALNERAAADEAVREVQAQLSKQTVRKEVSSSNFLCHNARLSQALSLPRTCTGSSPRGSSSSRLWRIRSASSSI